MASGPEPAVWPVLHYEDTNRALGFLVDAFGFREAISVTGDGGKVVHAELRWPGGGAVVLGLAGRGDGVHAAMRPGTSASYVVAEDVDGVHDRAARAGAEIVAEPHDTAFGSGVPTRAFSARDPEGNLWTFGTYRGAG